MYFSSKLSMYQSLLLSMLNIVLHLYVLVQQLNQQKFHISDMMYSIHAIAEDTDSISTKRCSNANFPVHLSYYEQGNFNVYNITNSPFRSLRSKTMMYITLLYYEQEYSCVQIYYKQSIPFATLI